MSWSVLWLSMLKEFRLIGGIGVRTARSIHLKSTIDAQKDQFMTFVTSVN